MSDRLFEGEDRRLLELALVTWGESAQEVHAVEELSELITALARTHRGRASDADVIDELADVLVVANQLALIYGREDVEDRLEYKLQRLGVRLDEEVGL